MTTFFKCPSCDTDLFPKDEAFGETNKVYYYQSYDDKYHFKNKIIRKEGSRRRMMGVVCKSCEHVLGISCAANDLLPTRIRLEIKKDALK